MGDAIFGIHGVKPRTRTIGIAHQVHQGAAAKKNRVTDASVVRGNALGSSAGDGDTPNISPPLLPTQPAQHQLQPRAPTPQPRRRKQTHPQSTLRTNPRRNEPLPRSPAITSSRRPSRPSRPNRPLHLNLPPPLPPPPKHPPTPRTTPPSLSATPNSPTPASVKPPSARSPRFTASYSSRVTEHGPRATSLTSPESTVPKPAK